MGTSPPVTYTDIGPGDTMLAKVLRWGLVPISQETWQPVDILATLQDEFVNTVVPDINSLNEEFFVQPNYFDVPVNWDNIYTIPSYSVGLDLRDVWAICGEPNTTNSWIECVRINPNQNTNLPGPNGSAFVPGSRPRYYVENNLLKFYGTPNNNQTGITTINARIFKKPSFLVSRANCAVVIAIDTSLNTVTLDTSNTAKKFSTGMTFDFITLQIPYPFSAESITPTNINAVSPIQTLSIPDVAGSGIQVGNLCCPTGTAPVLQYVPEEATAVLCQSTLCRLLDGQGNDSALKRAQAKLANYQEKLIRLLTPKVLDQTKVLTSNGGIYSTNAYLSNAGYIYGGAGSQ